jgi:hypothetical protein
MTTENRAIPTVDIEKMLAAVFTLSLLNGDLGTKELDKLVLRSRATAIKNYRALRPDRAKSVDLLLLGSVLHRWNRTPKYLGDDARPVPIRASGPAPSVEALFRAEKKPNGFALGLKQLRSAGLVSRTRSGKYLPRNDAILIHTLTPELAATLALSLNRLVSTLLQNTSAKGRSASRLVERTAVVPDLPIRRLEEFKTFSREQGAALISTMNDWLENRRDFGASRRRSSRTKTVSAGIHVFAFSEVNSK